VPGWIQRDQFGLLVRKFQLLASKSHWKIEDVKKQMHGCMIIKGCRFSLEFQSSGKSNYGYLIGSATNPELVVMSHLKMDLSRSPQVLSHSNLGLALIYQSCPLKLMSDVHHWDVQPQITPVMYLQLGLRWPPGISSNAPDVVFIEAIKYEIIQATQSPLGKFDNDAKSCYNDINCFLANISSQKCGQDQQICIVQGRTLEDVKYHLQTQLGASAGFIPHCQAHPIYGTGQDSGNSPVCWLFISITQFDCHALKAHRASFCTPDGSVSTTLNMLEFVDDTSNDTNYFEHTNQPTVKELVKLMQHNAQAWRDLLWATGGELELPALT